MDFPGTPASGMWSDALVAGFMDPTIPFSMAHLWRRTTFGQIDLTYHSFAPITIADPRRTEQTVDEQRAVLVDAVLAELHRDQSPDWSTIDRVVIFFAKGGTDLFGGGTKRTPAGGTVRVAVFDAFSPFSSMAQEIGHAFGLAHELDVAGKDYGCPYSFMSAQADRHFERPLDPRLPGIPTAAGYSGPCKVGPHLPVAHLYINSHKAVNPNAVVHEADSMALVCIGETQQRQDVTLVARDVAIDAWPLRRTVFAVIPPITGSGPTHFLELRRPVEYDGAIGKPTIFVLSTDFGTGEHAIPMATARLTHTGALSKDVSGYEAADRSFHLRVVAMEADGSAATVSVLAGPTTDYEVDVSEPVVKTHPEFVGLWEEAVVQPCRRFPAKSYQYRKTVVQTMQDFTAKTVGYTDPTYTWYANDVRLEINNYAEIPCSRRTFDSGKFSEATVGGVYFQYYPTGALLRIASWVEFADVKLSIRCVVSQPGKPARSATVTGDFDNIYVEWDADYQRDLVLRLEAEATEAVDGVTAAGERPGGLSADQIRRDLLRQLGIGIPDPR